MLHRGAPTQCQAPKTRQETHHADGGKHAHAAVLDLGLLHPLDVEVLGKAHGVETSVACVRKSTLIS